MKNLILILTVLSLWTNGSSCGWSGWSDDYFYELFLQSNITTEAYYPFLRTEESRFYEKLDFDQYNGNISLWKEVLPWSHEEIRTSLYHSDLEEVDALWTSKGLNKEIREYIEMARYVSSYYNSTQGKTWDYDQILGTSHVSEKPDIEKFEWLFSQSKIQQIKQRYLYQLVKLSFYNGQYQEAIDLFNEKKNTFEKNEIYYYTLDFVAGCYYRLKQPDKAAFHYLKVFANSWDRKKSAFASYGFCLGQGFEGKSMLNTQEDKADYLAMKALRNLDDHDNELNDLCTINPKDERLQLLITRALNNVERESLPIYPNYIFSNRPNHQPKNVNNQAKEIKILIDKVLSRHPNNSFWNLCASYMSYLLNDLGEAQALLKNVNSREYSKQIEIFQTIYTVESWNRIGEDEESYLLKNVFTENSREDHIRFVRDIVAHKYKNQNDIAKSYLCHFGLHSITRTSSIRLVDLLIELADKTDKTEFEIKLLSSLEGNDWTIKENLLHSKGMLLLLNDDPYAAKNCFDQISSKIDHKGISGFLFSNNLKECFSCDQTEVMTDSVFLSDVFDFIPKQFSIHELPNILEKLKAMETDPVEWKQKLAHYLLGNYYYNISSTGYFRSLFSTVNCVYTYSCYPSRFLDPNYLGAQFSKTGAQTISYTGFMADKSISHYKQVIDASKNRELNARCAYMIAKNKLNLKYNGSDDFGYERYEKVESKYYTIEIPVGQFQTDTDKYGLPNYSNTKFHKKIRSKCSYYRLYSNL
ncbi:MAG: hypothetical protein MRY83_06410 [Flavobacteriales bacterium]|nr:hypothetical protein [Flavobacteriales bacterium]